MTNIGRLAPSPTGLLHLGHARTFWIAHQRIRAVGGQLLLRDEDMDPQRSRPEFSVAMKEDLLWLGITWDAELRQSERLPLYRDAMQQLLTAGLAYPCTCSRKDLAQSIQAPHEDTDDEPVYTGRCRNAEPHTTLTPQTNYRFRIPTNNPVTFTDLNAGHKPSHPAQTSVTSSSGAKPLAPTSQTASLATSSPAWSTTRSPTSPK